MVMYYKSCNQVSKTGWQQGGKKRSGLSSITFVSGRLEPHMPRTGNALASKLNVQPIGNIRFLQQLHRMIKILHRSPDESLDAEAFPDRDCFR